jgi:hypothetical protein
MFDWWFIQQKFGRDRIVGNINHPVLYIYTPIVLSQVRNSHRTCKNILPGGGVNNLILSQLLCKKCQKAKKQ